MMQPRTPILLVAARALCAALPVGAQAADDKLSALTVAGATTAYTCDTEAFGMDFTPFKKTDGMIRLALSAKSDGAPAVEGPNAPAGSWTVALAVLKPEPLSVSISTFRGRDIVALEKGPCRKAELPSP
jgi:hypothetical protein